MVGIINRITDAQEYGMRVRPTVGGFPYLAEALRRAGVHEYVFDVPSASAILIADDGVVLQPGAPLHAATTTVPAFDEDALGAALRADQAGETAFSEFVAATFDAGVIRYIVDLDARTCTYLGARGERYREDYPAVQLPGPAEALRPD